MDKQETLPKAENSKKHTRSLWLYGLLAAGLLLLATFYMRGALQTAQQNINIEGRDQSAYLNFAKKMVESGYAYTGGRNRMPVYPFLLSLLYKPGMTDAQFFTLGKTFNLLLSLFLLAALFFLYQKQLPWFLALTLTLILAFTVFMHKAGYVQTELLFYVLNFAAFVLLLQTLRTPHWQGGVLAGALLGIAHLTKASVLPALILFVVFALFAAAMEASLAFRKNASPKAVWNDALKRQLIATGLTVITFLVIIYPYIRVSKAVFGHYFYNVNSTFYIWYDSWDEVKTGTRAHGDRVGWPQMPADEIPSGQKYLCEHTPSQILERFAAGFRGLWQEARVSRYFKYLIVFMTLLVVAGIFGLKRWRSWLTTANAAAILFASTYFIAYLILYAWYYPLVVGSDSDRFVLTLLLPFLLSASLVIIAQLPSHLFKRFSTVTIFSLLLIPLLLLDINSAFRIKDRNDYLTAYQNVLKKQQTGDAIMLKETLFCLDNSVTCDYYLNPQNINAVRQLAKIVNQLPVKPSWVADTSNFQQALQQSGRLWLIIHRLDLEQTLPPLIIQQIYAAMTLDTSASSGDVLVFQTSENPRLLSLQPEQTLNAQWENGAQLTGYTLDASTPAQLKLTLFWRNPPLVNDYKVFVHLRSADGANLAQTDETILAHIPYHLRVLAAPHNALFAHQLILSLPPGTAISDGNLLAGIYTPNTGERLPVINDQSGENGVWLDGGW